MAAVVAVVKWFNDHWPEIEAVVRPVLDEVINRIQLVIDQLVNITQFIKAVFSGDWDRAWAEIKDMFWTQWSFIQESLTNLVALLEGLWPLVRAAAGALADQLIQGFIAFFVIQWEGLKALILGLPGWLTDLMYVTWKAAKALGEIIVDGMLLGLGALVSGIMNKAGEWSGALINAIKGAWNSMLDWADANLKFTVSLGWGIPDITIDPDLSFIPRLAKGTRNFGGGPALVGEQGPELVWLPRGTAVTPAAQTAAALGGGVTVNHYHFHGFVGDVRELATVLRRHEARAIP